MCVGCSVVSLVILSLSGLHPIFPQRIMGVGPPTIRVCFPVFQSSKFGGLTQIIFLGNIGCRPLKLKITKDTTLHPTQIRQKMARIRRNFGSYTIGNKKKSKIIFVAKYTAHHSSRPDPLTKKFSAFPHLFPGCIVAKTRKSFFPR